MFVNIYFDTLRLKVIFLLNCESPKYVAKLFSLSMCYIIPLLEVSAYFESKFRIAVILTRDRISDCFLYLTSKDVCMLVCSKMHSFEWFF